MEQVTSLTEKMEYTTSALALTTTIPNYAMTFARNKGWTSPAKAIMGGASFVRKDYINKGQNTLYRIRWNPKNPTTHQYATAMSGANIKQYNR